MGLPLLTLIGHPEAHVSSAIGLGVTRASRAKAQAKAKLRAKKPERCGGDCGRVIEPRSSCISVERVRTRLPGGIVIARRGFRPPPAL